MNDALANPRAIWQELNPRARAVVIFAGLGILNTLVQALLLPNMWEASSRMPLTQPFSVLLRLAVALLSFAVVVWSVRPGRRTQVEIFWVGVFILAYSGVVGLTYQPALMMTVVPVVLRYWWSLRRTLAVSLLLATVLMLIMVFWPPGWTIKTADDITVLLQTIVLQLVQGGFAYAAFELTLRREEDRSALRQALDELQQYHGLELQHAALEERARISRELHDTLGHELTALRLEIQKAKRLTDKPDDLKESLARALTRSGESMNSLQSSVRALRPPVMDGTLTQAVTDLVRAWPVPVQLHQHGVEPALSASARLAAFRCVQEGLTNALKHAPGQTVTVEIQGTDAALNLSIRNPLETVEAESESGGSGLRGLQTRIEEAGGSMKTTCHDQTFELRAYFPVENK